MSGYIEGFDREQSTLFPERLEDWIDENNPVRAVDAFVGLLDLTDLGFDRTTVGRMGRPKYHPSVLLKLYIYGYLNRVQSSRRLEREAGRNVEVMWLTGRLAPDHKTIANFRKDNGKAIRKVCARFVALCREMGLLAKTSSVAIDGSKFKAVNHRDRNFTAGKLKRRLEHLEKSAARYLEDLDRMDRQDRKETELARVGHLQDKLNRIREEVKRLEEIGRELEASEDTQISLTDPDSRSMTSKGAGTGTVGYTMQSAVDPEHHLIVAHEVTNIGIDREQLSHMAQAAKDALKVDTLDVVADRGYFSGKEVLACTQIGVTATMPKPVTSPNRKKGLFIKDDFRYNADEDVYLCPAGQKLTYRYSSEEKGLILRRYWYSGCPDCPLYAKCTNSKERRVIRWEHEHVLEDMQTRLDRNPEAMQMRRSTVEHPFGTIKNWMGATHFQMKRLGNVATEMALHVLAYNLTRVMNIIGMKALMRAIAA